MRVKKLLPCGFLKFSPQTILNFNENFTRFLHVRIYAKLQNVIQLPPVYLGFRKVNIQRVTVVEFGMYNILHNYTEILYEQT